MSDYSSMSDADLINELRNSQSAQSIPYENKTNEQLITELQGANNTAKLNQEYRGVQGNVRAFGEGIKSGLVALPKAVEAAGDWIGDKIGLPPRPNGSGAWWGKQIDEVGGVKSAEQLPEAVRPSFYGGDFVGGAIGPGGLVGGLGRSALKDAATTAPKMLQWIGANPGKYAFGQIGSTATGATGTAAADALYPDSPGARLAGGLTGAVLSPAAAAAWASTKASNAPFVGTATNYLASILHPETALAKNLGGLIESSGESPAAIAAALRPGVPATVGANSQAIQDAASTLAAKNPAFKRALDSLERSALENKTGSVANTVSGSGSPSAFARAATGYENQLDNIVTKAETEAQRLGSNVAPNDVSTAEALNIKARGILEGALKSARDTESVLWGKVDQTVPVGFNNTKAAYDSVRAGMLPDAKLPDIIEKTVARFGGTDVPKLQDVQNFRSELLGQARMARAGGDFNTARRLSSLADGALEDMSQAGGQASVAARDYSRALNDRFSRSFAGHVLGTSDSGAAAVRPAQTLDAALTGKPTEAALRLRELQDASAPIGAGPPSPAMAQTQEQYIRQLGRNAIGPDGAVDPKKADVLLRNQATILAQFPDYRTALEQAANASRRTASVTGQATQARLPSQAVLGNMENPAAIIGDALKPGNRAPIASLDNLYNVASKSPDGVAGLRATIGAHVMQDSDPAAIITRLTQPVRPGQPSLLDWMKSKGIVSAAEHDSISKEANNISTFYRQKASAIGADLEGASPDLADLGARLVGSKLGAATTSGSGSSLVMASAGSRMARKYLGKIGVARQGDLLESAFLNKDDHSIYKLLDLYRNKTGVTMGPQGQYLQQPPYLFKPSAVSGATLGAISDENRRNKRNNYGILSR